MFVAFFSTHILEHLCLLGNTYHLGRIYQRPVVCLLDEVDNDSLGEFSEEQRIKFQQLHLMFRL
jgi:hypothetical protein